MLKGLGPSIIYVRISKNRFHLRDARNQAQTTVNAIEAFTGRRLPVGNFTLAERQLKEGMGRIFRGRLFSPSPILVMHPLEMVEGGISQVEDRVFRELAAGAGASKVDVWVGHELNDREVLTRAVQAK